MHRWARRLAGTAAVLLASTVVAGCRRSPSTLDPVGPKSDMAALAWWLLFGVAAFVCVVVIAMTVLAVVVRRGDRKIKQGDGRRYVLVLGVIIPSVILAATFGLAVTSIAETTRPSHPAAFTIDVVGHRWWWEFRYAGTSAVTANELHVPVDTPVELRLQSDDVIHSFWVPQVMPKIDVIPHRVNQTWLSVDDTGTYRGECAEYCGLQHAHMNFQVVAESRSDFDSWLQDQQRDATTPTDPTAKAGMQVFTTGSCATCHTIRGTSADGDVGPDLTHLATRDKLAGGVIPNDTGHLSGWIANSQAVKPGNRMPPQRLPARDLQAVVAYLQGLG